jgi:hypothetical protein
LTMAITAAFRASGGLSDKPNDRHSGMCCRIRFQDSATPGFRRESGRTSTRLAIVERGPQVDNRIDVCSLDGSCRVITRRFDPPLLMRRLIDAEILAICGTDCPLPGNVGVGILRPFRGRLHDMLRLRLPRRSRGRLCRLSGRSNQGYRRVGEIDRLTFMAGSPRT